MEASPAEDSVYPPVRRGISSPHPLNDALLESGFWDDPLYPHVLGKEEWEENFFGLMNEHMASEPENSINAEEDLVKAVDQFVLKWRKQQPGGRFLRRDKKTKLWNDIGNKEAVAFISNRLADAYDIMIKFEKAEARTVGERVELIFGLQRKSKIENQSSQDINVIISDEKVTCTRSTKPSAGADVTFVQVCAEVGKETVEHPPCQEAVVLKGDSEEFELDQKKYFLTVFTRDTKNNIAVHVKNRCVLAKQNWIIEEQDLRKQVESF